MCSLSPDLKIGPTSYGGRGVFTQHSLSAGTVLLEVSEPIAHVIYRLFRREACAECFKYDSGRNWRISSCAGAAWFCTEDCRNVWERRNGEVGMKVWMDVQEWMKKALGRNPPRKKEGGDGNENGNGKKEDGKPVSLEEIERCWAEAQKLSDDLDEPEGTKAHKRAVKTIQALPAYPDELGLFISGLVTFYNDPQKLDVMMALAGNHTPYRNMEILQQHIGSFLVLRLLAPKELQPYVKVSNMREIAIRDAHNSFGVWSQPEDDSSEMLGFGIWAASSYFNHSCDPAVPKTRVGRAWQFYLNRDVDPDEEICISYLGENELRTWTLNARQKALKSEWGFDCACPRCTL